MFACRICLGASVSAALEIGSGSYAQFINGFSFEEPALLRFYRWGFLLGFSGLLTGRIRNRQKDSTSMESARPLDGSFATVDWAGDGRMT